MAKIGLNNFYYSVIKSFDSDTGLPKYSGAKKPAKAVSAKVSVENNDAELYADDGLAESDKSFKKASVSFEFDKEDEEVMAELLGHNVAYFDKTGKPAEKGADGAIATIQRSADDAAPYVGFARIIKRMVEGKISYKAEVIFKAKFSEPSQEDKTQGDSLEFATTTLEGTASKLDNGDWSLAMYSANKADLVARIEALFKATEM